MKKIIVKELCEAKSGTNVEEVTIALSPAFGSGLQETIIGISLGEVVHEICAGIEEEGLQYRFIKVYDSTDLAIIASLGSEISGSGICVGIQSRGTTVIHQRDLVP